MPNRRNLETEVFQEHSLNRNIGIFLIAVMINPAYALQGESGSICVDPLPKPIEGRRVVGRGSVRCDAEKYTFKIDAQTLRPWPEKEAIEIKNFDVSTQHRVTVFCGGKAMESTTFRFPNVKTRKLCVFLNDLYWTIQIWGAKSVPWCRCK